MENLILYIVKALVKQPDAVSVSTGEDADGFVTYHLTVAEDDKGFVIGKQGKVAKAIRAVVKLAAAKDDKRVRVYID